AITDYLTPPADLEEQELDGVAEVHCLQAHSNDQLRGRLADADGIIVFHEVTLPEDLIGEAKRCRIIVRCGVGFDAVDLKSAAKSGIPVCNVPDYGVDEVADHTLGLILACNRGIFRAERGVRHSLSPWDKRAVEPVPRLAGQTMG